MTEEDLEFIKAYATGIFTNCGNYLSSSSTKFVPQISKEKFQMLIESLGSARMVRIWHKLKEAVYDLAGNKSSIDFPDKDGVTSYYSSNITSRDAELVKRFLISKDKVDLHWNSRL